MHINVFVEICGWIGASLILGAYALVSAGRVAASAALYQWMNVVGAAGFMVNGAWHSAWPSFGLNVVWLAIGLFALNRQRRAKSAEPLSGGGALS